MKRGALLALLCAVMAAPGADATDAADVQATKVYSSDFGTGAEHWTPARTGRAPNGDRRFLGTYGKKSSAILRLDHLPPHRLVRVRFTLLLLYAPAGNSNEDSPDLWSLSVAGGPVLLKTTFDTHHTSPAQHPQAFPDDYPINHPAATGAAERGSLGYRYAGEDEPLFTQADLVYHLEVVFPHTGEDLELRFASDFTKGPPDKAWALENATVETIPEFVEHTDADARQLWDDLIGRDAMRFWDALWRLAEGGPQTVDFVAQRLGAADSEKRAQVLVHDLTVGDALAREKANAIIDDLAPSDILMLRAALAAPETPESLRVKLRKIVAELVAESPVFVQRVSRLLRVLGTPEASRLMTLLENPAAPAAADSPMTLAWQNSHAPAQEPAALRCAFTPDGAQLLSIGGDGIRAWEVSSGKCVRFIPLNDLRSLAVSPDGATAAAGTKQSAIYIWSLPDWNLRSRLTGHRGILWSLVFARDSKQLWSGALDGIRNWDVETLQQIRALPVPAMTQFLSISPDGKMLAASQNNSKAAGRPRLTLRDGVTGEVFHNILDFPDRLDHSEFSPDGSLIAVSPFNGDTYVYSVETKKLMHHFDEPSPDGECAAFTPGGKFLCVAGGGGKGVAGPNHRGLHLYRLADNAEVWRFNDARKCFSAAFSPDGSHLAATDDEGVVYLWNVRPDLEPK